MGAMGVPDKNGVVLVPLDQRDDSKIYTVRLNSGTIPRPTARFRKAALDSGLTFLNSLTFDTFVKEAQKQFEPTQNGSVVRSHPDLGSTPGAAPAV